MTKSLVWYILLSTWLNWIGCYWAWFLGLTMRHRAHFRPSGQKSVSLETLKLENNLLTLLLTQNVFILYKNWLFGHFECFQTHLRLYSWYLVLTSLFGPLHWVLPICCMSYQTPTLVFYIYSYIKTDCCSYSCITIDDYMLDLP